MISFSEHMQLISQSNCNKIFFWCINCVVVEVIDHSWYIDDLGTVDVQSWRECRNWFVRFWQWVYKIKYNLPFTWKSLAKCEMLSFRACLPFRNWRFFIALLIRDKATNHRVFWCRVTSNWNKSVRMKLFYWIFHNFLYKEIVRIVLKTLQWGSPEKNITSIDHSFFIISNF